MKINGSCLCGEIEFEVDTPFDNFAHCYCGRCRKATGTGRSSVLIAKPDQLRWKKGKDKLARWDLPTAASFATTFCSRCGSPLPRLTRRGDFAVIPAGAIDDNLPVKPQCHEHLASQANWIVHDETDLPMHEGDER